MYFVVKVMKIYVLVDNNDGDGLTGEWGLSFYIEYRGKTVLLDTGLSPLFAENAEKMGLDLNNVDFAVLSHAHDDHANGLDTFFEKNDHAPLYVAQGCDENCHDLYDYGFQYAGIPLGIMTRHADRIIKADPDMYISDGIRLLGHTTPGLEELGLGMLEGMVKLLPTAEVGFLGMVRDETTFEPTTYAERLPDDLSDRQCFAIDPMLATGGSLGAAIQFLFDRGAKDVTAIMKYLVGKAPEGFDETAADFDGNGKINAKDVTGLMKQLVANA